MNEEAKPDELTAGRMVAAALEAAITSLREQAPGVQAGRDPDPVRKARVYKLKRTRAAAAMAAAEACTPRVSVERIIS